MRRIKVVNKTTNKVVKVFRELRDAVNELSKLDSNYKVVGKYSNIEFAEVGKILNTLDYIDSYINKEFGI